MPDLDMRAFARASCPTLRLREGELVFAQGEAPKEMYIIQSGQIEIVIGGKEVDLCGPGDAFGFLGVIDSQPRTSTARVKEDVELSVIDKRQFRFMLDEIPNFAMYVISVMAARIHGMSHAI
jgi:CRP/FNR family transcriptional regulator, cyclic AMP receptor protein